MQSCGDVVAVPEGETTRLLFRFQKPPTVPCIGRVLLEVSGKFQENKLYFHVSSSYQPLCRQIIFSADVRVVLFFLSATKVSEPGLGEDHWLTQ